VTLLAARADRPNRFRPRAGDECVVGGWPLGEPDGRKLYAGTALFRGDTFLALGRAVWFTVNDTFRDPTR
jgi:hypothetical protein